jgi:predicted PurR-regulated permease PerM
MTHAAPPETSPSGAQTLNGPREETLGSVKESPAAPRSAVTRVEHDIAPAAIFKVGGALAGVWLVVKVWPVVVLVLLSLMLVATFNPLVRRLQARFSRTWAITAVTLGVVLLGALLLVLMIPALVRQGQNLMTHLPQYAQAMEAAAQRAGIPLKLSGATTNWTRRVASLGPALLNVLATVLSGVTGVLTVAVLTIYLLVDGPRVGLALMRLLPRAERLPARQMLAEIAVQVGGYMRGQLLTSALAGLFAFLLLWALRVPEPLALAFLMAVADAIPMVGPLLGTVPAVLMALTRGGPTALAVGIGYVLYLQLENHLLVPRIYGNTMKLSASVIVIAILIGATLMGILGALLALPVAAAVPVVLRFVGEWREREADDASAPAPAPPFGGQRG